MPSIAPACKCGSRRFKADFTLEIIDAPVLLHQDGSLSYDDTKGHTDGWDTLQQPEVSCARCGQPYRLSRLRGDTRGGYPRYTLEALQRSKPSRGISEQARSAPAALDGIGPRHR